MRSGRTASDGSSYANVVPKKPSRTAWLAILRTGPPRFTPRIAALICPEPRTGWRRHDIQNRELRNSKSGDTPPLLRVLRSVVAHEMRTFGKQKSRDRAFPYRPPCMQLGRHHPASASRRWFSDGQFSPTASCLCLARRGQKASSRRLAEQVLTGILQTLPSNCDVNNSIQSSYKAPLGSSGFIGADEFLRGNASSMWPERPPANPKAAVCLLREHECPRDAGAWFWALERSENASLATAKGMVSA